MGVCPWKKQFNRLFLLVRGKGETGCRLRHGIHETNGCIFKVGWFKSEIDFELHGKLNEKDVEDSGINERIDRIISRIVRGSGLRGSSLT